MAKRGAKPTWTCLVSEALRTADDFMSIHQLAKATGGTNNQVRAALYHLQKHKVIDCVNSNDGLFWFYSDTGDTRSIIVDARVPEDKPRRLRNRSGNYHDMVRGERE